MKQVLIVDDHPAVGAGTKAMLEQEGDLVVDVTTIMKWFFPLWKKTIMISLCWIYTCPA